ncbi:WD40-repeat-containing domain protein [Globomyces pollinis-pini]|nr:WD40-repeat-containing domain protein [Globomyces pollinis-pini]
MRAKTLQILWHDKLPIFAIDFHPTLNFKFATSGGDSFIRIWSLQSGSIEFLATLARHSAAVNCIRWSPDGHYLASSGDDGSILLWEQSDKKQLSLGEEDENTENWKIAVLLRGTTSEVYDMAWSPDGKQIASVGIDSSIRIFDIKEQKCVHVLTDHCHFVQGIAWDPLSNYIATQSSDRSVHLYTYDKDNLKTMPKLLAKHMKMPMSHKNDLGLTVTKNCFLYHDEDLNSFFRRPAFSPDGSILITPAGIRSSQTENFTAYVYQRTNLKSGPFACLSGHKKPVVAVRFNPIKFQLKTHDTSTKSNFIPLDYRYIFAIATQDSVVIYDTQHTNAIAFLGNLHYASLTDISWSSDGLNLIMTSTDGFCSLVEFSPDELGIPYPIEEGTEVKETIGVASTKQVEINTLSSNLIKKSSIKSSTIVNALSSNLIKKKIQPTIDQSSLPKPTPKINSLSSNLIKKKVQSTISKSMPSKNDDVSMSTDSYMKGYVHDQPIVIGDMDEDMAMEL